MNFQLIAQHTLTLVNMASNQKLELSVGKEGDPIIISAYQSDKHLRDMVKPFSDTQAQVEKWLTAGFVVESNIFRPGLS